MPDRRRRRSRARYDGHRIAQTCWIITSVYFGFLIGELTKEALLPAAFADPVQWPRIILSVCTLCLYFLSAIEAYLWLNPRRSAPIRRDTALFRGLMLSLYVVAVITQAFLFHPLRAGVETRCFVCSWCAAMMWLLLIYGLYNAVWCVKRWLIQCGRIDDDGECPSWPSLGLYLAHYGLFALYFFILWRSPATDWPEREVDRAALVALLFASYLVSYLAIWWPRWLKDALSFRSGGGLD